LLKLVFSEFYFLLIFYKQINTIVFSLFSKTKWW
jgi:hypothetical protein